MGRTQRTSDTQRSSRLGFWKRPFWKPVCALAVVLGGWIFCEVARGETGTIHSATAAGLNVTIDTRWLDGPGYRPVEIVVAPTAPATVDRTLTVEWLQDDFWQRYHRGQGEHALRVVRDVEVPAGSRRVQATLLVPQTIGWSSYRINVLEDGQRIGRLSFSHSSNMGTPWQATQEGFPKLLIVGDQLPDMSPLIRVWPLEEYERMGFLSTGAMASQESTASPSLPIAVARPVSALPTRWIAYTNLDIVCLGIDDLTALAGQKRDALLRWTASGGNLWVWGVGQEWERLAALEALLETPPASAHRRGPSSDGWQEPDRALFNQPLQGTVGLRVPSYNNPISPWDNPEGVPAETPAEPPPPSPPDRPPFKLRAYGMGQVVALASEEPFPGTQQQWTWLLNTTGSERWLWYQRHGLSVQRENDDFWEFLIPGIGLAPVTAFVVLISLFVVLIGPLNYFLLRRWRRLHLMLLTTPAAAGVVTLALFAYAVVADGLGTRVRVRSVTQLDQRNARAVCWARLSYYSGIAPADGLRFPADVAVLPLDYSPWETRSRQRMLIWLDDQWLAGGWLTSRRPTQYLTLRARPSHLGLKITKRVASSRDAQGTNALQSALAASAGDPEELPSRRPDPSDAKPRSRPTDGSAALSFENHLGTRIEQILIRDKDGKYYWASGVAAGSAAQAGLVDPLVACQRLQKTFEGHRPLLPPGTDPQSLSSTIRSADYMMWYYHRSDLPEPTQSTSLLEAALRPPHASSAGTEDARLRPGSYLAVVARSPEVELGTSAEEEASFHVILGTW